MTNEQISLNECQTFDYLKADGYSDSELSLMFGYSDTTIRKHINNECGHPNERVPPVRPATFDPDALKAYLHREGIPQRDFASHIGVSTATLRKWIEGKSTPRTGMLWRVREVIGLDEYGEVI